MIFETVLAILAAYLLGSVPFGFLIGKYYHIDIRTVGSKNIGATNVTRCVGKKAGKVCFFLDFFKGLLPVLLTLKYWPDNAPLMALGIGVATILGHVFPVYLKFRGGKGVATAGGVALALAPYALITALIVWYLVFYVSRYVSLGSIVASVILPVAALVYQYLNIGNDVSAATIVFLFLIGILSVVRHISNIKRILNGTESKFERKKSGE